MTSQRRPRLDGLLVGVALALFIAGCSNPNEVFSGVWQPVEDGEYIVIDGVPTLALGHFGREVAGVVYFNVPGGSLFRQPCACAFVDHLRYNADESTLEFESVCDGQPVAVLWNLELTDDPLTGETVLQADVRQADGLSVTDTITFRKVEDVVSDAQRACPPE